MQIFLFFSGSPPRHLLVDPAVQERIKKIPSIFDIETHPPNQSPNKPSGHGGPPNMMHPPHMQPPRWAYQCNSVSIIKF